ncbi:hypothetical protein L1987_15520 [Smallanthus sonchifolius]|uniref:Uncharacterized protein n=1 Tax=Smallanthus sonchifolius TaxID=185202 RepID=A0ACB9J6T4_9ASTR|nr:hypothetical protein L1987_15520 [Smallanthus sonchifolius]
MTQNSNNHSNFSDLPSIVGREIHKLRSNTPIFSSLSIIFSEFISKVLLIHSNAELILWLESVIININEVVDVNF